MGKSNIWSTIYPEKFIDVFKGKKQANILNLLGSISILGESQTPDMAKFVLSYGRGKGYASTLRYRDYHKLQSQYHKLLLDKSNKLHGGKKILDEITGEPKKDPSPAKFGYAIIIGSHESTKGIPMSQYFLTLKGFLLVVGYNFTPSDLKSVIENASKISKFFGFIKFVMDVTSIDFVTEIFIKPIRKVLLRSDIFQGGNMDFYFDNFANAISESLSEKMKLIDKTNKENIGNTPVSYFYKQITPEYRRQYPHASVEDLILFKMEDEEEDNLIPLFKKEGIESLMDNVFYYENQKDDLYASITEHFYTSSELKSSFLDFGYDYERILVGKVMQSIHFIYYRLLVQPIPKTPRKKLLRSKSWKGHRKYKRKPNDDSIEKYGIKEFDLSNL